MTRFLIALSLLMAHAAGFALPTLDAVQAEIQRGHYTQAEDMMREVVTAKPGSARAHYVYAELLAHDRRFNQAAEEAALARRLDPDLRFTQPEKFNAFTRLLEREQGTARAADRTALSLPPATAPLQTRPPGGVPGWVWGVVGLGALALLAWRALGPSPQQPGPPIMKLKDKICIVTGAASGIGKEIGLTHARAGGKVAIADINKAAAQASEDEIKQPGGSAMAVAMDVTNEAQVNAAVAELVQQV